MGGACGYGNLYQTGFGTNTAAASIAMWNSGGICGSCFQVKCVNNKYCRDRASVTVTVTNLCPQGSNGGWCNYPRYHLDMAYPAFAQIASDPKAGIVETEMTRVPCPRKGGITFMITGNPFWTQILPFNVGGSGDVSTFQVSIDGGKTWQRFARNWGNVWSLGGITLLGHSLSFRITTGAVQKTLVIMNATPNWWYLGGTYSTNANFPNY